jgi:formyl-CoA transferase
VVIELVEWADVFIVNTPHHARKHLGLEYEDISALNPRLIYADLTGFGDKGPDANLPGFDLTAFWARSGLLAMAHDAGASPTWPVSGVGDNATAVSLYAAIATALYRRERTGKGCYVTTSLLATGVWSMGVMIAGALAGAPMPPLLDRANPANAGGNVYRSSDGIWFVLAAQPDKVVDMVKAMGRDDLLTDPRFADPAKIAANRAVLTAILADTFAAKPMAHWADVLGKVSITYGIVAEPADVAKDPQLTANDIAVPLAGAGKLTSTISSPFQVVGVDKAPARRGPGLGEHNEEILADLGFDANSIAALRESGAIPEKTRRAA